jgi:hypothetical protein
MGPFLTSKFITAPFIIDIKDKNLYVSDSYLTLLVIVFLYVSGDVLQGNTRLAKHGLTIHRVMVPPLGYNPRYTTVNKKHSACTTRRHPTVQGGAVNGYAPLSGLANSILLSVYGTHTVSGYGTILMHRLF